MKIKKAVIPAAGWGTRLLPATKAQPKEMLPIVDKPSIQYIVEEAVAAGIEDILIITSKDKQSIEDHFDKSQALEAALKRQGKTELLNMVEDISEMITIHSVRQKEQKGLGHAIYCAKTFVGNDPFAVLLGDDIIHSKKPVIQQMMEIYEEKETAVLGCKTVAEKDVNKYGIVDYSRKDGDVYRVEDMVEKPSLEEAPSNLAILGRYIITPDIFNILENTPPGKGGEIQLTDALKTLLDKRVVYGYDFEGKRYDVGNKMGFLKTTVELALAREDLGPEFKKYLKELTADF
ncbi:MULTISPECIES: UTP--glucose-1-phosphate uridylyltransferase GalU [Halanaerobium]|jgi:UTP--glucose-1-phosphate uridylyltransferase|uniref:UTP--glucose-1-phosphate uridylyltransferase n=2 Tax=Halanaerobium TaxID=2330 RepID=A0A4R6RZS2_9FIRM|nr:MULTISPECIES: UTP--glucose-1-phosphate uridylyltransferase GalU [Halanaerobium]KXS48890.1 MAG: UTP--glucose-1-phosphate uridylyltransferase [Halanaerobium sp. T82-1]PUU91236.1 MAG: UTP--glucose-1-phosphate uridylyltransferase [Halanaerobium sp.]PUU95520.1 MAG: UTP--glucose-1-phosphate uridylyltransferase [Halanaerobium sp.]RCW58594.1 UDP-glucose pyrophosphorylase [Halanaerobium sp. ST460_2HS_T2]TDP92729.1 UDP-glucose pyrophosphorylase [Halanaerobium saccharolyticum]